MEVHTTYMQRSINTFPLTSFQELYCNVKCTSYFPYTQYNIKLLAPR